MSINTCDEVTCITQKNIRLSKINHHSQTRKHNLQKQAQRHKLTYKQRARTTVHLPHPLFFLLLFPRPSPPCPSHLALILCSRRNCIADSHPSKGLLGWLLSDFSLFTLSLLPTTTGTAITGHHHSPGWRPVEHTTSTRLFRVHLGAVRGMNEEKSRLATLGLLAIPALVRVTIA